MFALYFLIGIACFVALFTLFNRYYIILLPRRRERLYIVVEGEIPHIEAILRELYGFLQQKAWFEPMIVDSTTGDSRMILERLCQSYTLPLEYELPQKYVKTLYVNKYSNIKSLKRELSLLRSEIELRRGQEHKITGKEG